MADKILSLESIKKCLEKIKELLGKKADVGRVNNPYDFNDVNINAGFYRFGDNIKNGPTGMFTDGNMIVVRDNGKDTLAKCVIPFIKSETKIAIKWGNKNAFSANPWYYFHGSTSPNIPVLKKKTLASVTTDEFGNYTTNFSNIIPLFCYTLDRIDDHSITCIITHASENRILITFSNLVTGNKHASKEIKNVTLYYLEIPEGYEIPEATTASSDETEDDEGFSPQSYSTPETKQFHGESLYE